ncbi:MAG: putative lipid II flippase FtsW [Solirubrobacterales bacterium]
MRLLRRREPVAMTFEHSMLRTATLCLLAFGAVMVYSASSGTSLLSHTGDSSFYLKRYLVSAGIGLVALMYFSRCGLTVVRRLTPVLLVVALVGLLAVLLPGVGISVNGARRWVGFGTFQVQPSEIAKLALVLYAAGLIGDKPARVRSIEGVAPLLLAGGVAALLIVAEPDLGTAIVVCMTLVAILMVSGFRVRHLMILLGGLVVLGLLAIMTSAYRRDRLTAFLDPWADPRGSGFQSVQAMIAIGSGGPFGVGLGESVQKLFYLPEAHTDMVLAVIGEELGMVGVSVVLFLYGMIAYAGLRAARMAKDLYAKLVAAGITSVILVQATLNFFAVLGIAPLTGVPLPFISYGNSNLVVLLVGMGVLINIAQTGGAAVRRPRLEAVAGGRGGRSRPRSEDTITIKRLGKKPKRGQGRAPARKKVAKGSSRLGVKRPARKGGDAEDLDRSRRDRRSRRARAGNRRRAAG